LLQRLLRCAACALLVAVVRPALAHPMNVGYADIDISSDGVRVALSMNLFELDLLLGLDQDKDARVEQAELDRSASAIADYLSTRVSVGADGKPIRMTLEAVRITRGADGKDLLEATLRFPAGHAGTYTIRCEPLSDLGPDHRTLAKISFGDRIEQFVFQKDVAYRSKRQTVVEQLGQFLELGVVHIFTGYDHLLFLFGLLLAATSVLDAVKIVTAFTLAHSITLALAALGVVTPPNRVVEAGIALSIVYVAVENLVFTNHAWRWVVSLCFGLVHGFGFANVLHQMDLTRSSLVSALLSFNLGVELGQLAIVLLLLPLLGRLRRSNHFPLMVRVASVLILVQGLRWFYERALM
jgi:hydrogenase/urease accessory protein HupE